MREAWDYTPENAGQPRALEESDKRFISDFIFGTPDIQHPNTEDQLGRLQIAIDSAIQIQSELQESGNYQNVHQVAEAIRRYMHLTACQFHYWRPGEENTARRFDEFKASLSEFIQKGGVNVATLNYDKLLYSFMIENNGCDGFFKNYPTEQNRKPYFCPDTLDRKIDDPAFPLYLHLHGSPLFLGRQDGVIEKQSVNEIPRIGGSANSHIVLSNLHFKQSYINESEILTAYWKAFRHLIQTADHIILFGYSGYDEHLNALIRLFAKCEQVTVVEWRNSSKIRDGLELKMDHFWQRVFNGCNLVALDDILSFRDWCAA